MGKLILTIVYILSLIFGTVYVTHFWGYSNWLWILTIIMVAGVEYKSKD